MTVRFTRWTNPTLVKDKDDFDDDYEPTEHGWMSPYQGTVAYGPMGFIPLTNPCQLDKIISLWTCECDNEITDAKVRRVAKVPGVELCRPLTRYRLWLGVASLFDDREVRKNVAAVLDEAKAWALVKGADGPRVVRGDSRQAVEASLSGLPILSTSWGRR